MVGRLILFPNVEPHHIELSENLTPDIVGAMSVHSTAILLVMSLMFVKEP